MLTKKVYLKRIFFGGILLAIFLATLGPLGTGVQTLYASSDWDAKYWNNTTMSGDPALQRFESTLDHDWGRGAPASGINADRFSARWERTINVSSGNYRFTATMDDGLRLWVDGTLIIDSWWDSQVHSLAADIYLSSGEHHLKVEYYDAGGDAVAKLH